MTDTNNKEETFESEYSILHIELQFLVNKLATSQYTQVIYNISKIARSIKNIKQLHDQSLVEQSQKDAFVFTEEMQKLSLEKDKEIQELNKNRVIVANEQILEILKLNKQILELQAELKKHERSNLCLFLKRK
jgi:hypothetical protein